MPLSQSLRSKGFSINTNDVILRQTCTACVSATRNWNRRMKIQVPILKFSKLDSPALHTLFWTHDKQHVLGSQHYHNWLWSQPEYTQHLCKAPENISLSVVKRHLLALSNSGVQAELENGLSSTERLENRNYDSFSLRAATPLSSLWPQAE